MNELLPSRPGFDRRRSADQAVQQPLLLGFRRVGHAGMDRTGLDDGAARCGEPPEPIALRTGRAGSLTGAHRPNGVDGGATAPTSTPGSRARKRAASTPSRPRDSPAAGSRRSPDVDPLTPVDAEPRTARRTRRRSLPGSGRPRRQRSCPRGEVLDVNRTVRGRQPLVGHEGEYLRQQRVGHQWCQLFRSRGTAPANGASACSSSGYGRRAKASIPGHVCWNNSAAPWSTAHNSRCQTSRFGLRQLRSTLTVTASSQITPRRPRRWPPADAVVADRSRQEVDPEVRAGTREQEFLHLRVGLTASDGRIHLDEHQLRDADPKTSSQLTHDDLGHQRLALGRRR